MANTTKETYGLGQPTTLELCHFQVFRVALRFGGREIILKCF